MRKYLIPWANKLTTFNEKSGQYNKLRVFDCFAGRGSYVRAEGTDPEDLEHLQPPSELPGSPLIILDRLTDRHGQFEEADCVLIEQNENNFQDLEDEIQETSGIASNVDPQMVQGSFQDRVLDLVEETGGRDFPTLFFLDPFGFKSLDYDVICELAKMRGAELLITFMYRDMHRFLESDKHEEALARVFGTEDWKEELEEWDAEQWEPLAEYYEQRLEDAGFDHTFSFLCTEPETEKTVYYLVFATHHPAGIKTMREVMSRCGTGRFAYAPRRPEMQATQARFDVGDEQDLNEFLLEHFAGKRISFDRVVRKCSVHRRYHEELEADIREAIRQLEEAGEVDIQRVTSEETGITDNDLIDFPLRD